MLFNDLYATNRFNAADIEIDSSFTVTTATAHSPLKVVLATVESMALADVLWLVNDIRNPYKELTEGKVLRVPASDSIAKIVRQANVQQTTVQVKHASITDSTISF